MTLAPCSLLQLLKKESPELLELIDDYKSKVCGFLMSPVFFPIALPQKQSLANHVEACTVFRYMCLQSFLTVCFL